MWRLILNCKTTPLTKSHAIYGCKKVHELTNVVLKSQTSRVAFVTLQFCPSNQFLNTIFSIRINLLQPLASPYVLALQMSLPLSLRVMVANWKSVIEALKFTHADAALERDKRARAFVICMMAVQCSKRFSKQKQYVPKIGDWIFDGAEIDCTIAGYLTLYFLLLFLAARCQLQAMSSRYCRQETIDNPLASVTTNLGRLDCRLVLTSSLSQSW